jgi:phosphoribosylamine-glycine ligase
MPPRRFVIASKDYVGLGFATRLREEGHEVLLALNPSEEELADEHCRAAFERVGDGMVEKVRLGALLEKRKTLRDWYWVWDFNHSVAENELLRREGFKVLGGGVFADRMEHDREAGIEFVSRYGIASPESEAFTDVHEAIAFCEQHREVAYCFKPDEGAKFETFVPESEDPIEANEELRVHLETCEHQGAFILQERKEGVETNVEVWFQEGEPVYSFMGIESKKKYVLDLGPMVGCAMDYVFSIPLDCRAVNDSMGKLFPAYREMRYTGFGDTNFIAAKDGVWFFEKCERFGYNSHANLFYSLSLDGVGEVLASLVDRRFTPHFAEGFGASVLMSTKEGAPGGKVIQFPEKLLKDIYFWDAYKKGERYYTAGYDACGDVLLVTGSGYTMPTAWETVMKKAAEIRFPYRHYRPDGDQTNYPSSPIRRYEALKAMGYI